MTTLREISLLLSMPFRILGFIAVETGKSFAVLVGTAFYDSRGGFHWRA